MKKDEIMTAVKKVNDKFEFNKKYLFLGAIVLIGLIAGCQFYGRDKQGMQMPSVNVTAYTAEEQIVNNPKNYVAIVQAINSVDVVAKVSGTLDKVNFIEGNFVKKDEPLFIIDKETYQVKYDLAKAQLESAKANLTKTERDFKRQKQLSSKNIASKATFDSAESAYLQAKAAVSQCEANLRLAEKDLINTEVKAYIDGYVGKAKVTVGNYVNASSEILARVVQTDPIRIAFSITDKEYLEMKALGEQNLNDFEVNIELASGEIYKQKMDKVFASNEVSSDTATVAVYADIKNEKGLLKPGAYVKMFVTTSKPKKRIVVPEKAVVQSAEKSNVYVIADDNTVFLREVELGESYAGNQVILNGLNAGERIVVNGIQNRMMRPGATVNIVEGE